MEALWGPVRQWLKSSTIKDVVPEGKVVHMVPEEATVRDALDVLTRHKILSVPVVGSDQVRGLLDLSDIAAAAHHLTFKEESDEAFFLGKAVDTMDESMHNRPVPAFVQAPVITMLQVFARGWHRFLLYDTDLLLYGMVSQSDAAKWLWENKDKLGLLKDMPLGGFCKDFAVTIDANKTALDAIELITLNKVSAVAVTVDGKISFNFSSSNLRGLEHFVDLKMSLSNFVTKYGKKEPLTITKTASVLDALEILVTNRVHRVWITDSAKGDGAPVGVFSLTDLMTLVVTSIGEAEKNPKPAE